MLRGKELQPKSFAKRSLIGKKYGYTFEVLFFCSMESKYTMFHLLNLAESKKLSKRLGAEKFTVKRTKNEWKTAQEVVDTAKNNHVKEIIMAGERPTDTLRNPLWKRVFYWDKYNYILKKLPDIILVVINHSEYNPFEKEVYRNGRQGYLVKKKIIKHLISSVISLLEKQISLDSFSRRRVQMNTMAFLLISVMER